MIPKFLRPEVLHYASVEIVSAAPPIDRAAFHRLLVDPRTSARLDAMLEDNRRIDAAAAAVVVELEIVPPATDAPRGPVVDVVLEPKKVDGAQ